MAGLGSHDAHADGERKEALSDRDREDRAVGLGQVPDAEVHVDAVARAGEHQAADGQHDEQYDRDRHGEVHEQTEVLGALHGGELAEQHGHERVGQRVPVHGPLVDGVEADDSAHQEVRVLELRRVFDGLDDHLEDVAQQHGLVALDDERAEDAGQPHAREARAHRAESNRVAALRLRAKCQFN